MNATQGAPRPPTRHHVVESPQGSREDEYYWLRDDSRTRSEVLDHLRAENAWTDHVLAPLVPLRDRLYEEIVARIKQDDSTVPVRRRGYWYYTRYEIGREYPIHARRQGSLDAPEEILLDLNAMVDGKSEEFLSIDEMAVSPDDRLLAYAEDRVGRREYVLRVRDLTTGELLPDRLVNAEANVEWTGDSRSFLYVEKDPVTLLGIRVRQHVLGTAQSADRLVWEQSDDSFYTSVHKTKDERFLLIGTRSTVSSEWWYADATAPRPEFRVFLPRERDHEYEIERFRDRWIVRTNWQARNYRIVEAPLGGEGDRSTWRDLVPHRDAALVHGFDVFPSHLAIEERVEGLRRLRLRFWDGLRPDFAIQADDPAYAMGLGENPEPESDTVRYVYSSLTTPRTTWEFDPGTGERRMLKRDPVLGDFDPSNYVSEFVWADARDGVRVPVSIVYRRGTERNGSAPLLISGYGAYGLSQDPTFSTSVLSLLDRGFVYAIAHVRGGQELGRRWYDEGRLLAKQNSFNDFVDVTRWLVAQRYADPKRVFARGGSAGGLLMGAVVNQAPELYRGVVSLVPFVDIVTTMLDPSIPLTTNEYDEWGDPRQQPWYDCMLAYSPYDNLVARDYPAMYVGTGLWDSQVQYWEPAKYVARLRRLKTDSNPLVFRVNMEAGHGGKSGRFQRYRELAEQYAFILWQAGLNTAS